MFTKADKSDYIDDEAMNVSIVGASLDLDQYLHLSVVSVVTAAAALTGNLISESSNDGVTWVQRDTQAVAANGTFSYEKVDHEYRYFRHRWVATGGNGTLNTHFYAKGM